MSVTQIRGSTQILDGTVTDAKIATGVDAVKIADGSVSNAEFQFLDGVSSNLQVQLDNKASTSLTNLSSVAINSPLLPASDNTLAFGSSLKEWSTLWAKALSSTTQILLTAQNGQINFSSTGGDITIDALGGDAVVKSEDQNVNIEAVAGAVGVTAVNDITIESSSGNIVLNASGFIDASNKQIQNLADPVSNQDAATKVYVDNVAAGLDVKAAVRVGTTANLSVTAAGSGVGKTLTATANGAIVIDGVSLSASDRVLVKNQTTAKDNGIYTVTTVGDGSHPYVLTRATDFDGSPANEVQGGDFTFILAGTANTASGWVVVGGTITVDTDPINWTQFNASTSYVADESTIHLTGNVFSVKTGGITDTQVNAAAAISRSKLASGTAYDWVTNDASGVMSQTAVTAARAVATDANGLPVASATTATELGYVSGVTSAIQTQLNGKASTSLGNLASVAINTSLLPASDNTIDLGDAAHQFRTAYIGTNILNANGSAGAPAYSFATSASSGMYLVSTNLFFSTGGTTQLGIVNAGQLQGRNGAVGAPTYSFLNDNSSGWYRIGSGDFGFSVSGTKQLEVTSSGLSLTNALTVANGGTGVTSLAAHAVVLGAGTSAVTVASPGTAAYPLVSNGAASDPSFQQLDLTAGVTGILPIVSGGTNSNATLANGFVVVSSAGKLVEATGSDFSMNNGKLTNVKDPTAAQDAATKKYVDMSLNGLDWKQHVQAATAAVLPTSAYSNGTAGVGATITSTDGAFPALVIDGYTVLLNDRILVKNQASSFQNGIYIVTSTDNGNTTEWQLTRATDSNTPAGLEAGTAAFATNGTANSDRGFLQTATVTTIGTSAVTYLSFTSAVSSYFAGNGLDLTIDTFSISTDDSLHAFAGGSVPSLTVKEDPAGAIVTNVSAGIAVNVDNTTIEINSNALRVKAGGVTYAMSNMVTREVPSGAVDGSNAVFTLAFSAAVGSEQVFLNGILQDVGGANDYTISGATITFTSAPAAASKIRVTYWKA